MNPPPPPPLPAGRKRANLFPWILLGAVGLIVVAFAALVATIVIPALGRVRDTTIRQVDQAHVHQIVQAGSVWSSVHDKRLPPVFLSPGGVPSEDEPATVHGVAAALARGAGLNDMSIWFSRADRAWSEGVPEGMIIERIDRGVSPVFLEAEFVAWDFATGLDLSMPGATPVAWTRGLRPDGTWSEDGVYGSAGGFIGFLGGNAQFFRDLQSTPLATPDGSTTNNILEALPASARVVGSGPATLHGERGLAANN